MFHKVSITVVLDTDEIQYLKEQASSHRLSLSAVLREAIEALRKNSRPNQSPAPQQ
jgi:hypothetical protein